MDSERISPPLPAPDSPERGTAFIRPLLAYAAAALCDESAAYSAVSEAVISAAEKQAVTTAEITKNLNDITKFANEIANKQ